MAEIARFATTGLLGANKSGELKPDADGYYTVVLGALDVYNSGGAFYPANTARELFKDSSSLMRRIQNKTCRGEVGHPRKEPGMSLRDYIVRVCTIQEDKIAFHVKEVWLDEQNVKDKSGRPVIAIMGKVCPSGPHGEAFLRAIKNPYENLCFSIRSITNDVEVNGVVHKHFKVIVTWDWVNEPGLEVANRYSVPTMECRIGDEVVFTQDLLVSMAQDEGIGQESLAVTLESILADMGWARNKSVPVTKMPPSAGW